MGLKIMIVSFFGHSNFIENENIKETLLTLLEEDINGSDVQFCLGGYGNFDDFALKCCKEYKSRHKNTSLMFITPYINEWLNNRKEYYQNEYDEIIYPDIERAPLKYAISKRNEWIINYSDLIITYVQVRFGGAYNALRYANRKGKKCINLIKDFKMD